MIGIPFGTLLALNHFRGRNFLLSLVNTGMGLPPVVVGLFISILLWRSGPLGDLQWIYTPIAIVIAQVILATPVVAGLTTAALQQLDPRLRPQLIGLGASPLQTIWMLWMEARLPLLAALMAGFGSVISEVGASMMVGGQFTSFDPCSDHCIVYETGRGNFAMAIALGVILLALTFSDQPGPDLDPTTQPIPRLR